MDICEKHSVMENDYWICTRCEKKKKPKKDENPVGTCLCGSPDIPGHICWMIGGDVHVNNPYAFEHGALPVTAYTADRAYGD